MQTRGDCHSVLQKVNNDASSAQTHSKNYHTLIWESGDYRFSFWQSGSDISCAQRTTIWQEIYRSRDYTTASLDQ